MKLYGINKIQYFCNLRFENQPVSKCREIFCYISIILWKVKLNLSNRLKVSVRTVKIRNVLGIIIKFFLAVTKNKNP